MKKVLFSASLILCTAVFAVSAMAATLSPALDVIAHSTEMTVSATDGGIVKFAPSQFAEAAGVSEYDSIRITELPDSGDGSLMFKDASVCSGQVIAYDKISDLSFMPGEGSKGASFEFTFDGSYTMKCAIVLTASENKAPTAGPTPDRSTFISTSCSGVMRASDPDGDDISFEVTKYPESGKLIYDKSTGAFTYMPEGKAGSVSFEYRVSDKKGGVSNVSAVSVSISDNVPAISFADMDDSDYVAAAVTMADMGVMTYSDKGSKLYFEPSEKVTRLEFLVSAMNAFGAKNMPVVSSSGFEDDADIPDKYKPYVYSAAKLGIVNGIAVDGKLCFMPDKAVTASEAAVILNNVIGYEAKNVCAGPTVPVWAESAVSAVYELGITDINTNAELTKETAADMLYKLCSLIYE